VLEAWNALDSNQVISETAPVITVSAKEEKKEERSTPVTATAVREATKPVEDDSVQPMMSDFGP
jgi:hypothetical protein